MSYAEVQDEDALRQAEYDLDVVLDKHHGDALALLMLASACDSRFDSAGLSPENGSSRRITRGCVAAARAISTRRLSPSGRAPAGVSATCVEPQASQQRVDLLVLGGVPVQEAAGERIAPRPRRRLGQAPRQREVLSDREFVEKLGKLERARQAVPHPRLGREP